MKAIKKSIKLIKKQIKTVEVTTPTESGRGCGYTGCGRVEPEPTGCHRGDSGRGC